MKKQEFLYSNASDHEFEYLFLFSAKHDDAVLGMSLPSDAVKVDHGDYISYMHSGNLVQQNDIMSIITMRNFFLAYFNWAYKNGKIKDSSAAARQFAYSMSILISWQPSNFLLNFTREEYKDFINYFKDNYTKPTSLIDHSDCIVCKYLPELLEEISCHQLVKSDFPFMSIEDYVSMYDGGTSDSSSELIKEKLNLILESQALKTKTKDLIDQIMSQVDDDGDGDSENNFEFKQMLEQALLKIIDKIAGGDEFSSEIYSHLFKVINSSKRIHIDFLKLKFFNDLSVNLDDLFTAYIKNFVHTLGEYINEVDKNAAELGQTVNSFSISMFPVSSNYAYETRYHTTVSPLFYEHSRFERFKNEKSIKRVFDVDCSSLSSYITIITLASMSAKLQEHEVRELLVNNETASQKGFLGFGALYNYITNQDRTYSNFEFELEMGILRKNAKEELDKLFSDESVDRKYYDAMYKSVEGFTDFVEKLRIRHLEIEEAIEARKSQKQDDDADENEEEDDYYGDDDEPEELF